MKIVPALTEDDLVHRGEVDGMFYELDACKDVIVRRQDWIDLINFKRLHSTKGTT